MHKLVASCFVASVLFTACNTGSGAKSSSTASPSPMPAATATPTTTSAPRVITTTAPQPTMTSVTAPGMNPPHGQPGHRCDIAVGAPLNSKPAPSITVPGNSQPSNITINQAPAQPIVQAPLNMTGKRLNPPHGQPGHRCDVQVGQPLP